MMHFATILAIRIYSTLLEACVFVAVPLLHQLHIGHTWNLRERNGLPLRRNSRPQKPVVWIHAASLGESKLLIKFLGILETMHPDHVYVLTSTTKNGVRYLSEIQRDSIIATGFLPFDTLRLMNNMLNIFAISRLWIMETELWPSLLCACLTSGIPVGIVNARMEYASFSSYRRLRCILLPLFAQFDTVLAQSKPYAERFIQLGVRADAIHLTGNLKSLVPVAAVPAEERKMLRNALALGSDELVLTAGCVHAGEGTILRQALDVLTARGCKIRCIVIPRYPEESYTIAEELGPHALLISEPTTSSPWTICIIACIGILDAMYKLCDMAFIGGTFVPVGGHNVWDAARHELPVLFGPDYHTQQESCLQLLDAGVGFCVADARSLAEQICRLSERANAQIPAALATLNHDMQLRLDQIKQVLP